MYVSPSGSDSNNGLSAAESVKTIGKAIEICTESPLTGNRDIYVAAGTYTEHVTFKYGNFVLHICGNVVVNGSFSFSDLCYVFIRSESSSPVYSLTINSLNSYTVAPFDVRFCSNVYADVVLNINVEANSEISRFINVRQKSFLQLNGELNITSSVTSGSKAGVLINNDAIFISTKKITFTGGYYAQLIFADSKSCIIMTGGVDTINVIYSTNGVYSRSGSAVYLNGESNIQSTCPICAYHNALLVLDQIGTSTFTKYDGSSSPFLQSNARSYIYLAPNGSSTITFNFGSSSSASGIQAMVNSAITFYNGTYVLSGTIGKTVDSLTNSYINFGGTISFSGEVTGKRFNVQDGSKVQVGGRGVNFIPGSTAGTVSDEITVKDTGNTNRTFSTDFSWYK